MMKPKRVIRGAGEPNTGCRPHAQDLTANLRCEALREAERETKESRKS
jgi:hypothetical protein